MGRRKRRRNQKDRSKCCLHSNGNFEKTQVGTAYVPSALLNIQKNKRREAGKPMVPCQGFNANLGDCGIMLRRAGWIEWIERKFLLALRRIQRKSWPSLHRICWILWPIRSSLTWIGLIEPKGCLDPSQLRIYREKNGRIKKMNGQDPKNYNQSFNIKTDFNQVIMGALGLKIAQSSPKLIHQIWKQLTSDPWVWPS